MSELAIFWIVFAIVLGIVESFTINLVTIWFAIGAFFAFVVAIFTDSVMAQCLVFAGVSLISMISTRPIVKKLLDNKTVPTNSDRIIGATAVVIEKIDEISGKGQVKALGQVWSAKTENGESIEKDETVIIKKIEGVRVVVSRKD